MCRDISAMAIPFGDMSGENEASEAIDLEMK